MKTDSTLEDKATALFRIGYYIGIRDPARNSAFDGAYMVCADVTEGPSEDASNTGFCIVGDDLKELIEEAYADAFEA